MAESLRRLVNIGSFSILQEKLDKWLSDYNINSCDQNVTQCCEVIELNARVQSQLFKLLSLTAGEGGVYGGSNVIKSRLLPWLSQGLLGHVAFPADRALDLVAESAAKDREINHIQDMYEHSLNTLEADLSVTKAEASELRTELLDTKDELDATKRASASEKMFTESEVQELKAKLRVAEDELISLRGRTSLVDNYEYQVRRLRDDLAILTGRKEAYLNGFHATQDQLLQTSALADHYRNRSQNLAHDLVKKEVKHTGVSIKPYRARSPSPLPRSTSPIASDDITQQVRQQNLITRFNDMFAQDRLDAMEILRRYSDDHENNQRIIFSVLQEAFAVAKLSFSNFKLRVRSNLAVTHMGPETLEEAVQDYINCNTDMYDLPSLVLDTTRALKRNPKLQLPPEAPYSVIQPFIREACKLAWNMSALAFPLDIALGIDAELHDEHKYRRSYDSEFTAPLVGHHIWPCLQQRGKVVIKGEVCTRRGASLGSTRRSRSPTRSVSPSRALSPSRSPSRLRSRSPSPSRLHSSLSGRGSPGPRSIGSRNSSRAVTASTALSHYGVTS